MTNWRVCAAAFTVAAAAGVFAPAQAIPSYDGVWSVVIMTKMGICDPSYRYPIRISNGRVGGAGGNGGVSISGKVGRDGSLVVNVSAGGGQTATGTGRLNGRTGTGSWTGGNGACSGVWQAERRS